MKKTLLFNFSIALFFMYFTSINTIVAIIKKSDIAIFQSKLAAVEKKLENSNNSKESFNQINTQIKETLVLLNKASLTQEEKYILQFKFDISLAYTYNRLLKSDSALYYFNEVNRIIRQYPKVNTLEPLYVAYHYNNLGQEYMYNYANYTNAISYYQVGLRICDNIKNKAKRKTAKITLANNLANVYDKIGNTNEAFNVYKEILKIGIKGIDIEHKIYTSMGWNCIRRDKYDDALLYFKQSLSISKKTKISNEENALYYFDIGTCYSHKTDYFKGNKYLDLLIDFYQNEKVFKNKYLSLSYLQKAKNSYEVHNYNIGLLYTQEALKAIVVEFNENSLNQNPTLSQTVLDFQSLFQILTLKAQLLEEIYQKKPSNAYLNLIFNCYHLAVVLSTEYRKGIENPEDKLRLNQNNKQVLKKAIYFAYKWYQSAPNPDRANDILSIIESTKAIVLGDKILDEKVFIPKSALPIQYKIQNELSVNANLRQNIANKRLIKADYDSLKSLLHKSETKLSDLKMELNSIVLPYNKGVNADINIREIIAHLSPESVYLSYSITEDYQVYVLAINHEKIIFKKLEDKPLLISKTLQAYIDTLKKNPTVYEYKEAYLSKKLYNYLIKPIESMLLNKKRLVISRDGLLNYLPFEVLESGKSQNDYLLNHFAISYQYTALSFLSRNGKETNTPNKLLTINPFIERQVSPDGDKLEALKTFTKSRNEDFLSDQNATKLNFIKKMSQYNIFNLECHSVANQKDYSQSFVYFNPSNKDWKLGFHEILNLNLSECKLLILASCNSGFGQNEAYEAILSLGYAFYKAGSHAVISAQWSAHDRSSAFITTRFYHYINQGIDKDYALQKAKIDFLNSELGNELNHPFFWANLTLTGNTNPIESPTYSNIYLITLIPIIFIFMIYAYKKNKS